MKKKILALCLVIALAVTAVTGATLAYFTDVDQNTNEFAVGNVKIDLYEDVKQTDGKDKTYLNETDLGKGDDSNPNVEYENIQPGHVMTKVAHVENTGKNDAYVALVIKHDNYYNFNMNVDEYYENDPFGYSPEQMQKVTDDVFPNWNLLYDKTQVASPNAQVRYTIDTLPTSADAGVKVLGVGYVNSAPTSQGVQYYNYSGAYFTNCVTRTEAAPAGEPDFMTMGADHDRAWIVYLQLAPGAVFDMDLTTVCPTYFDENSATAFEGMALDIKAFAIQCAGFTSDEAGQKAAFAEALKPGFNF